MTTATTRPSKTTLELPELAPATRSLCLGVADRFERELNTVAHAMARAVFSEVPVYRAQQQSPEMQRTVLKHSVDHVHAVAAAIRSWSLPSPDELRFVRAQGALRANQQVPLNAMLHSYRIGHRTTWERLIHLVGDGDGVLDAVLALTTLTLGYTDAISSALVEGYLEQQRLLVLERDRERRDLLETLLQSDVGSHSELLQRALGFDLGLSTELLVLVIASASPPPSAASETLTRAADAVRGHLATATPQPLVVIRKHEVVAVLPVVRTRPSAWARLARAAHAELSQRDRLWAAGLSTVCSGLGEVRRGYDEARQALEWSRSRGGVTALFEVRVSDYLVELADSTARRMVPVAARRLFESTTPAEQSLVETLLAYAASDMAVRVTADRLAVHPNTVSYRLGKIRHLLGRDPTRFSDLVEVLAWARLCGAPQSAFTTTTAP